MKFFSYLLIFSLVFLAMMCPKRNDTNPKDLPPITQTGANTFGCLINGIIYEPSSNGLCPICYPFHFDYVAKPPSLNIGGDDFNNTNKYARYLSIVVSGCETVGKYKLGPNQYPSVSYATIGQYHSNYFYDTNDADTSYVYITRLDTTAKIISGTFSFQVRDSANNIINVTNGRFDRKYTN